MYLLLTFLDQEVLLQRPSRKHVVQYRPRISDDNYRQQPIADGFNAIAGFQNITRNTEPVKKPRAVSDS